MKPLSLIIITYDRPEDALDLAGNISRLEDLDLLVEEVVIVNNRSTVSYRALEDFIAAHPAIPFRYVTAPENLGVSRGRNYAITLSKAPILLFLDDDAIIHNNDALRQLLSIFDERTAVTMGIAAFKVFYQSTGQLQQNAFPHKQFAERRDWPHFDTSYFSGCAHAIRRDVFEKTGVYPDNFFYGMEEYDLSYRTLDAGYVIRYDNRVSILHKESPSGRLTPRSKLRGMWINKSRVAWKYLPLPYFFSTAFLWSLEYLKGSNWHVAGFVRGWGEIIRIPGSEKRTRVGPATIDYLRRVKARLLY